MTLMRCIQNFRQKMHIDSRLFQALKAMEHEAGFWTCKCNLFYCLSKRLTNRKGHLLNLDLPFYLNLKLPEAPQILRD